MLAVIKQAAKIASTDGIVLLTGESGSGKDYLARWIHNQSLRSSSPYFAVNCAALSAELAESELFGHEAGSFTGARGRKRGMLELAEGGTLLLNEIGELPLPLQSKLLTFLDTRSFLRVGGERSITVDARLMAATHRDLGDEASQGRFLEPLYHRLNVFNIKIPPLRERAEDMPILVDTLIAQLAKQMQLSEVPVLDPSLVQGLNAYKWPGNVRELRNVIERALMLWDGEYFELKLPAKTSDDEKWSCDLPFPSYWKLREVTDEITKSMVMQALRRTGGNKKEAAKMLGTSRDALYRYIKRFGIRPELLT
jgi:DNA-binding NtrC family response regulator